MKPQAFKLAALLALCSQPLMAGPADSAESALKQRDQPVEALPDPGAATGKSNIAPPASNHGQNTTDLEDPTRLNENFRAALEHAAGKQAASGNASGGAVQGPALPDIALVASVCPVHKGQPAAMLRIKDKTEMVRAGDRITYIENNQLVEIQVIEIDRHHVRVRIYPGNETVILR